MNCDLRFGERLIKRDYVKRIVIPYFYRSSEITSIVHFTLACKLSRPRREPVRRLISFQLKNLHKAIFFYQREGRKVTFDKAGANELLPLRFQFFTLK